MFLWKRKPDNPYATLNRRMWAATIDWFVIMLVAAPVIDFILNHIYGASTLDFITFQQQLQQHADHDTHLPEFWLKVEEMGWLGHWTANIALAFRIIWITMGDMGERARWLADTGLQFAAFFVYSGVCWKYWSATLGAIIMRVKVVDAVSEAPLSTTQILWRLVGYIIATLPLLTGFFWMWTNKRRQGWHDVLAHSVVIRKNKRD